MTLGWWLVTGAVCLLAGLGCAVWALCKAAALADAARVDIEGGELQRRREDVVRRRSD